MVGRLVVVGRGTGLGRGEAVGCGRTVGGSEVGDGAGFRVGRGDGDGVEVDFLGVGSGACATSGASENEAIADRAMKKATAAATKTSRKAMRSGDIGYTRDSSASTLATYWTVSLKNPTRAIDRVP